MKFGGGPAVSHAHECGVCARAAQRLRARRARELAAFADLHTLFQEQENPLAVYAISMAWFRQWQGFVRGQRAPPPPLDNRDIVIDQEIDGIKTCVLKPGSDHAQLSEELWRFFTDIYGGGPEVRLKSPPHEAVPRRLSRKYSESDKEEYCTKSTSEMNIRDTIQSELQKNQSLQNINRRYKTSKAESDEEITYRNFQYKKHEPNGNYDSDEEMDVSQSYAKMENGIDSSDHDANDNPITRHRHTDTELPNLDSISLKNKPKSNKVRKMKRRTVK